MLYGYIASILVLLGFYIVYYFVNKEKNCKNNFHDIKDIYNEEYIPQNFTDGNFSGTSRAVERIIKASAKTKKIYLYSMCKKCGRKFHREENV